MNRFLVIVGLYIFLLTTQGIAGQYYQYKDAGDTLIFTDDLSQVPMDQRPGVRSYESVHTKDEDSPQKKDKDLKSDSVDHRPEDNEKKANWFKEEEKRLILEKDAILASEKEVNTPEKRTEYNRRINALNEKIEAYKVKLEQFKKA